MNYLLDTCVISEFVRPSPSDKLIDWLTSKDEHCLYISVLTLGELQQGISKLDDGKKKHELQHWLDHDVSSRFDMRILPIDKIVTDHWGRLRGKHMRQGLVLSVIDSLLAATAIAHGMTIVTRNVKDMQHTDAMIKNPWL